MIGTMALKPLAGQAHLLVAVEHNKRTMYAQGVDPMGKVDRDRSHLNYSLGGAAEPRGVVDLWKQLREAAGIFKPKRKDEMSAIEVVFSLPHGAERLIDLRSYFADCTAFACRRFGSGHASLLCSVVHLDQDQPHCHVLVLPLVDGKMQGAAVFYGTSKTGGEPRTYRHHLQAFFTEVASNYGLKKAKPKLAGPAKKAAAKAVRAHFSDRGRLFQADRGRRFSAIVDARGLRASEVFNVSQSSTISLKRGVDVPLSMRP